MLHWLRAPGIEDPRGVAAQDEGLVGWRESKPTNPLHDTVEAGKVIGTEPPAGAQLQPGGAITVVVSKGPELVAVPNLKGLIVEALGDPGAPRSLDVLLLELERASGPIREAVIAALGKLGDLRAVGVLLPLVTDDSPAVRARVAEALGRLGVRAAEQAQLKGISPPL